MNNTYEFQFWFRYGNDQKDFDIVKIDAKTESDAFLLVREERKWVFGIKLLSINGVPQ